MNIPLYIYHDQPKEAFSKIISKFNIAAVYFQKEWTYEEVNAIEWVQLPNTRGMSQYADGGKIATKPYISSASYIDKMSDYCQGCQYDKNKKTEDNACPFNSLYWNFLDDKRKVLEKNRRMKLMYSLLDKMDNEQIVAIKEKAHSIINNQNSL